MSKQPVLKRRTFASLSAAALATALAACKKNETTQEPAAEKPKESRAFEGLKIDAAAWHYDEDHDCYYQLELPYCLKPAAESYQTLSIYVPGAYFKGEKKGETYTVELSDTAAFDFEANKAACVLPLNSAALSAQKAPSRYAYDGLDTYLEQGLIYVYAGFRGKSQGFESGAAEAFEGGAPWPAVDLKAALRFLRLNARAGLLPMDENKIFAFGYGYAGGLAALLAASGNAEAFEPYLEAIGAATEDLKAEVLSDSLAGMSCWNPISSFGTADAALSWALASQQNYAQMKAFDKKLAQDLAASYASYINGSALHDKDGANYTLDAIEDGSFSAGSYYDWIVAQFEKSALDFIENTSWPYTKPSSNGFDAIFPGDPNLLDEQVVEAAKAQSAERTGAGTSSDGTQLSSNSGIDGVRSVQTVVYDNLESYLSELNKNGRWIRYSSRTKSVRISGLWPLAERAKSQTQALVFDAADRSSDANLIFGSGKKSTLHFSEQVSKLLQDNADAYKALEGYPENLAEDFAEDLKTKDSLEQSQQERAFNFDPLSYLLESSAAFGKGEVAPYWRIRAGVEKNFIPFTMEMNLALALGSHKSVQKLDFAELWEKGEELAELSGSAEKNFVAWVREVSIGKNG